MQIESKIRSSTVKLMSNLKIIIRLQFYTRFKNNKKSNLEKPKMGSSSTKSKRKKNQKSNNSLTKNEQKHIKKCFLNASNGENFLNYQEFVQLFIYLKPDCVGLNIIASAEQAFIETDTNFDGILT